MLTATQCEMRRTEYCRCRNYSVGCAMAVADKERLSCQRPNRERVPLFGCDGGGSRETQSSTESNRRQ
jgi:hypothetical protein